MLNVIPPGTQLSNPTGQLTITLKPIYQQSFSHENESDFRLILWGRQQPIYFKYNQCKLSIHSSIEMLSYYLNDMNILHIQCISSKAKQKYLGSIYINLRRYIIQQVINQFSQNVNIIDKSKKKIGECNINLTISMLPIKSNKSISIIKQFNLKSPKIINTIQDQKNNLDILLMSGQTYKSERQQNQLRSLSQKHQHQHQHPIKRKNSIQKINYQTLSQVMKKYPHNNPSLQIMQLRMDEIQFLNDRKKKINMIPSHDASQYKIYFDKLKILVGKSKQIYFKITYQIQDKNIQTNIPLKQISSNLYILNFVCLIKKINNHSIIEFQTNDGKCQIKFDHLISNSVIYLKKKDNSKKFGQIYYQIFNEVQPNKINNDNLIKQENQNKKIKMNKLIKVIQSQNYQIEIQGKNFDVVKGNMVIYSLEKDNSDIITIRVMKNNILKGSCVVKVNQIYKQQIIKIPINDKQNQFIKIKVISAKGQFNDLIKISQSNKIQKSNQIQQQKQQKRKISRLQYFQIMLQSFNKLQMCQNHQCKQIVDKLIQDDSKIKQLFPKLVKQAQLNQQIIQAFENLLHSSFTSFWANFIQYTFWNSKYKKAIRKLIRNLQQKLNITLLPKIIRKKIPIMFGLIREELIYQQLMKYGLNQNIIQNLIALLIRSHKQPSIKLVDIQNLVLKQNNLCINGCLLMRIYYEIESDQSLCILAKTIYQTMKIGNNQLLLKLLNEQDDQISNFSQQIDTQGIQNIITDPEKTLPKKLTTQQQKPFTNDERQYQQPQQIINISLWINGIIIYNSQKVKRIIINNDLVIKPLQIPTKVMLLQNQDHKIKVQLQNYKILEGVFMMNKTINKITLFLEDGIQAGQLLVGNNIYRMQNSHIEVQYTNKLQLNNQDLFIKQDLNLNQQIQINRERIKSQKIKIKILNVSPNVKISFLINNQVINYPSKDQILLQNQQEYKLKVINTKLNIEDQSIYNYAGTTTYDFSQKGSNEVSILVTIQLVQYLGRQYPKFGQKVLICNILHLQSLSKMKGLYQLHIQGKSLMKTLQKKIQKQGRSLMINQSFRMQTSQQFYNILFLLSRQVLASFSFKIRFNQQIGIYKHYGYLIDDKGYRISLSIIQINYNDIFCNQLRGRQKFQRLLNVFQFPHIQVIYNKLMEGLTIQNILRTNMFFTLSQIDTLMKLVQRKQYFQSLFQLQPKLIDSKMRINQNLNRIYQQFELFDINNSGLITIQKAQLINTLVFTKNPLFINSFQVGNKSSLISKFYPNQYKVDYIFILWNLRKLVVQDNYFQINISLDQKYIKNIQNKNIQLKKMKISLIGYKNLRIGKYPATLSFRIYGKQFADPIPRSYSHMFLEPLPYIIEDFPCKLQIFNKQYGLKQLWKYVQVEQVDLKQQIQILEGVVFFKIQQLNENISSNVMKETGTKQRKIQDFRETRIKLKQQLLNNNAKRIESILNQKIDYSKFDLMIDQ